MHISQAGLGLIKKFEGFAPKAYICPAGKNTQGYGHVIAPHDDFPEVMDEAYAESLLQMDCIKAEDAINEHVVVGLTQNQFDALVSFVFNLGARAFQNSTLLKLINAGDFKEAAKQFHRWTYAAGKELPGLVERRRAEAELWNT